MTPALLHAAALALLDRITPGPWWTDAKYRTDDIGCVVLAARTDAGPLPGNPTRGMVAVATELLPEHAARCGANARAIAALPELAEAWRKGLAYREAEHDYVAAAEAEDADYDPLKVGDMRARLHAAAAAFDAALAAVADRLTGEGK